MTQRGDSPAAIAHRWWHGHSELDERVSALLTGLERDPRSEAPVALDELFSSLVSHFTVEETVYFGIVSRLLPELAPAVSLARQAHASILACCEQIRTCLIQGEAGAATERTARLLADFHTHEEHEHTLIRALERLAVPSSADPGG